MNMREASLVERNEFKNSTHKLIRDAGDAYLRGDTSIPTGASAQELQSIVSKLLEQLAKTQDLLDESRKDAIDISNESRKETVETQKGAMELARITVKESNLTARDSIATVSKAGEDSSFATPARKHHRAGVDASSLSSLKKKVVQMEEELKETKEYFYEAVELFGEERDCANILKNSSGRPTLMLRILLSSVSALQGKWIRAVA